MHVEVKDLAPAVRDALERVRYGERDIQIVAAERVETFVAGGDGMRGFVVAVNLDTGERKGFAGSWGGSNPWSDSPVDSDAAIELPLNGAVIKGTTGYPRTFATVYAHPNTVGRFLPSGEEEQLGEEEQNAIYCFAAIKGGEYRREELERRNVSAATVDSLVERGYLKRNRAGATQITTQGKNARTLNR
jgi:hypothetical protein